MSVANRRDELHHARDDFVIGERRNRGESDHPWPARNAARDV
jgi:hypothetical protein